MTERERLIKLMETENLSAKQFAIEVGVQPGTISNIMSGRNNPSLDVMQRVLNRFRTVNADWLILGIGQMYRPSGEIVSPTLFDIRPKEPEVNLFSGNLQADLPLTTETNLPRVESRTSSNMPRVESKISGSIPLVEPRTSSKAAPNPTKKEQPQTTATVTKKEIEKIMIFYSDGTYEER